MPEESPEYEHIWIWDALSHKTFRASKNFGVWHGQHFVVAFAGNFGCRRFNNYWYAARL